jgi:hypothetical protein
VGITGVTSSRIYDWRDRRNVCTPETAIELADIAGENGAVWALRAIIEKHRGTANEAQIMRGILSGVEQGIVGGEGEYRTITIIVSETGEVSILTP